LHFTAILYILGIMATILPVGSGKGGVGKTLLAANLGVSLARHGKTVILVDLDLGSSNLHTIMGIKNRFPGIGSFIYKHETSLESLVVETGIPQLYLIPGDSLFSGTANLSFFMKRKIIKELYGLVADYVILDLGAGSAYNTIDFFLTSLNGIVVTTPETTAILNAYSFLKTAIFRLIFRSFPARGNERDQILNFMSTKIEGTGISFANLIEALGDIKQESADIARTHMEQFFPRIILNMGKSSRDLALGGKLREIAKKNIGIGMEYIGYVAWDDLVSRSVFERVPTAAAYPASDFSRSLDLIGQRILSSPVPFQPNLYEANEDLSSLGEEYFAEHRDVDEAGNPDSI